MYASVSIGCSFSQEELRLADYMARRSVHERIQAHFASGFPQFTVFLGADFGLF